MQSYYMHFSYSGAESVLSIVLCFLGCVWLWLTGHGQEPPPLLILLNQTGKAELTVALGEAGGGCGAGGQLRSTAPCCSPLPGSGYGTVSNQG